MKMKLLPALMTAFALSAFGLHAATVLVGWDFNGLSGGTNNFGPSPFNPGTAASNLTFTGLTRGSGIGTSGTGAANAWGGNDFITASPSFANAVAANEFVTFSITPDTDYTISFDSIAAYNIRRSGTGPATGQWQYQIGSGAFVDIGTAITWGGTTTAAGNLQSSIDLSGIAGLQNVAETVTFRIVTWGATGSAGTWYLNNFQSGNDLIINGSIQAIPEPSRALLAGFGVMAVVLRRRRRQTV